MTLFPDLAAMASNYWGVSVGGTATELQYVSRGWSGPYWRVRIDGCRWYAVRPRTEEEHDTLVLLCPPL